MVVCLKISYIQKEISEKTKTITYNKVLFVQSLFFDILNTITYCKREDIFFFMQVPYCLVMQVCIVPEKNSDLGRGFVQKRTKFFPPTPKKGDFLNN